MSEDETDARLRAMGEEPDEAIDVGEAALLLGSYDRPRVGLERYRDHLAALSRDVAAEALLRSPDLAGRVEALNAVLVERGGYAGDVATYDDLQNANLLRVIDRRRGLPVALGILYIGTARRLGWDMAGLAFPSHFLVRLDLDGERAILDPFHGGRIRPVNELREMLKAAAGPEAELEPAHYASVGARDVLLRLQNNIKLRLMQRNDIKGALAVVDRMLLLAPRLPDLLREAGLMNARLGKLQAAIARLEECLAAEAAGGAGGAGHRTAALLQELRRRLH